GGLDHPLNFGILLDREKAGKDHLAIVFTLRGTLKVKWKSISEGTGQIFEGDKQDERSMTALLKEVIGREEKQNVLKMDPQQIMDRVQPDHLRRSVLKHINGGRSKFGIRLEKPPPGCHDIAFSPSEIGHIHFDPSFLSPKQVWGIEKVLSRCDDRGEADFQRVDIDRKPYYAPYTDEAVLSVNRHIHLLEELRSVFLEWVEEEDIDDDRKRRVPKLKVDDISSVELGPELKDEMDRICGWAVFYLENGWWPLENEELICTDLSTTGPFGLGGTDIRRINNFDLERFLDFLSMDMTSGPRGDRASNLVTLLLLLRRIDWREASELVVKYNMGSGARKFHEEFQNHVIKASERLPDAVGPEDGIGREDLTELQTYTIDPVDAKDFDDAVSIIKEGGLTKIWVHIADVSHYVRPGDLVDAEARFRATSVYLPTRVIPMLPSKLSEDLCSLREGVRRLSLSTLLVFDEGLKLLEWKHVPSVIMVNANLDYQQVDRWIDEGREPFVSLHKAASVLEKRGARLEINTPEKRIRFSTGSSIDVSLKRPTKATKMIEELMVATNECAARFLEDRGVPTLFRVHPLPDRTSAEKFNTACETLGLDVRIEPDWENTGGREEGTGDDRLFRALLSGGKISFGAASAAVRDDEDEGDGDPKFPPPSKETMDKAVASYNRAMEGINEVGSEVLRDMLNLRVLRTLGQAFYSVDNIGHFGLRSMSYLHFTSPIRRYPDILVHRAVKACLAEDGDIPDVGWFAPDRGELEDQMEHTNDMTDSAEDWERDMIDVALSTRIRMTPDLLKGAHSGIVTSLTPASCFMLLDDGVTEGRISYREMSPYPLTMDENESMVLVDLTGEAASDPRFRKEVSQGLKEAVVLKLGDKVSCRIARVSIATGRIDLDIERLP
ncbi:MAG: RNB domain-containing ribonuclease, partial [Thermoplasmatota archaeon]